MNIRHLVARLALATALSCASPLHAQVLGGSVNSAVGGTLSGGARSVDAMGSGSLNGSLGVDASGAGHMRDRAGHVTGSVQKSTRAAIDHTRQGTETKAERAQGISASVATGAAVTANGAAELAAQRADATANSAVGVAGSAQGTLDSTVQDAGSAASSQSGQATLDSAAQADLLSEGSVSRASTADSTQASGTRNSDGLDLEAGASASSSTEASVTTSRE